MLLDEYIVHCCKMNSRLHSAYILTVTAELAGALQDLKSSAEQGNREYGCHLFLNKTAGSPRIICGSKIPGQTAYVAFQDCDFEQAHHIVTAGCVVGDS